MRGVEEVPGAPGCAEPLLCVFPGADGSGFGFDPPASGVEPGVPLVEPGAVPGVVRAAVPGKVPHGEPLGEVPGVVDVFGLTVEG